MMRLGWFAVVLVACGDDGGESASGTTTATTPPITATDVTLPTTGASDSATATATTTGMTASASEATGEDPTTSLATSASETGAAQTTTSAGSSTGEVFNAPPVWDSLPGTDIILEDIFETAFEPGQIFLASSRTDEIRVYDGNSLMFLQAFTHPEFSETPSDLYTYGPNGMAFNERGNLVVAGYDAFVEFSDYGIEYAVYPKVAAEATENLIFDALGNLYTTTATNGSDRLNQYAAADYAFVQQIGLPANAGQLTGITFDGYGSLYLASQSDNTIHVTNPFSKGFTEFTWMKTLSGAGNPGNFEGIQFNATGELVAAAGDLVRYNAMSTMKVGTFDGPDDAFPVPLRVDNEGNIYTSDYENGSGSVSADIFKFTPAGDFLLKVNDPGLFGPFGLAISGTVLAGDPPVAWNYQLAATDPDGDELTYAIESGPPDMFLDLNTDVLTWYVTSEDIGMHDVELSVSDGVNPPVLQSFTLIVSAG